MTVPAGAYAVNYQISIYHESSPYVELDASFSVALNGVSEFDTAVDTAAEAAADLIVDSLHSSYPTVTISKERQYLCRAPGDAWPAS